jgi:hypothetical protein
MTRLSANVLILLVLGFFPAWLRADGALDERQENRRLLEKWKKEDPERYERLLHDLQDFRALPAERQDRLRALDRALQQEGSARSARLHQALERYNEWLQGLPEADRRKIETAAAPAERLDHIKAIRRRQWLERLPRAYRERLHQLETDPVRYEQQLQVYRDEERERRREWNYAIRNWDLLEKRRQQMQRAQQLAAQIKTFVQESLSPLLTAEEKWRLKEAQPPPEGRGDWPGFLAVLVELADKHPIKLPPSPKLAPVKFEELPAELRTRLQAASGWPTKAALATEGKYPDYAVEVLRFAREKKVPHRPLPGPGRLEDFAPSVQKFCRDELFAKLTEEEKTRLHKAEGRWPIYPRLLRQLATEHKLPFPGMALPGPRELWDTFRQPLAAAR